MPDKRKFMTEMARVAKPGGRIILVTWCVRALGEGESDYTSKEKARENTHALPCMCACHARTHS
jgi:ubiquinone/menaquinone biosynthesis C-methylase UbiE